MAYPPPRRVSWVSFIFHPHLHVHRSIHPMPCHAIIISFFSFSPLLNLSLSLSPSSPLSLWPPLSLSFVTDELPPSAPFLKPHPKATAQIIIRTFKKIRGILIRVRTELIKLLIFAESDVGSCMPPPPPKLGSNCCCCWEEPQPTFGGGGGIVSLGLGMERRRGIGRRAYFVRGSGLRRGLRGSL